MRRLERDVFPWIGNRPIGDIHAPEILTVLRRIEARGASTPRASLASQKLRCVTLWGSLRWLARP
jgi:hypothetical protein